MPPRVSNYSFFLSFLSIWLAALFHSFLFQRISCLFAKFKGLVVREDDNNTDDSDPKVENENDFSKLIDLVGEEEEEEDNTNSNPKATSLTEQQKVFELWCYCYKRTYSNQAEKNMRFGIFQKALSPPLPKPKKELWNTSAYADLTREELNDEFSYGYHQPAGCYVSPSDIHVLPRLAKMYRNEEWNVESSDEECWNEECSDEECWDEDYARYLRLLEQSSDGTL